MPPQTDCEELKVSSYLPTSQSYLPTSYRREKLPSKEQHARVGG